MSTQSRFAYIFFLTLPASHLYSSSATALSSRNATCSSTTTLVARALARPKANQQLATYKYSGSTQAALKERAETQRTHCVQVEDVPNTHSYTVQEPTDEQETTRSREADLLTTQAAIIRQQQQELEEARAALKAAQDEKKAKEKKKEEQSLEQLYQEVNDVYINAANAFENDVARKKAKEDAQAKEAKAKEEAQRKEDIKRLRGY